MQAPLAAAYPMRPARLRVPLRAALDVTANSPASTAPYSPHVEGGYNKTRLILRLCRAEAACQAADAALRREGLHRTCIAGCENDLHFGWLHVVLARV